jgi:hypothetical protein
MWLIGALNPVPAQDGGVAAGFLYAGALLVIVAAIAYGLHLASQRQPRSEETPQSPPRSRHIGRFA